MREFTHTTTLDSAPVEMGFARRSARYLSDRGCSPTQIRTALIEQLDLTARKAEQIVNTLPA